MWYLHYNKRWSFNEKIKIYRKKSARLKEYLSFKMYTPHTLLLLLHIVFIYFMLLAKILLLFFRKSSQHTQLRHHHQFRILFMAKVLYIVGVVQSLFISFAIFYFFFICEYVSVHTFIQSRLLKERLPWDFH